MKISMTEAVSICPAISFSPTFVAAENGTSVPTITRACQNGRIDARKVGKQWRISGEERDRILREGF